MKLELGKWYRTREGEVVQIVYIDESLFWLDGEYPMCSEYSCRWTREGGRYHAGSGKIPSQHDLVEELTEEEIAMYLLGAQK